MIKNLALIMDGNRRWAKKKGLETFFGHRKGADAAQIVVDFCLTNKIPFLTLYLFSLENLKRSEAEKKYLFDLLIQESEKKLDEYVKKGVRVRFNGERSLFPPKVLETCNKIEERTKELNNLQLNFLFFYGGRQEIVSGVKEIIKKAKNGEISETDITEENFTNFLWTKGVPDPDLIIRTGGQNRLSNFLIYQSCYSELFFLDCLWPDITEENLKEIVNKFNNRQRNFGV